MTSTASGIRLTFGGTITNRIAYEYHTSKGGFVSYNSTHVAIPIQFTTDMQLGIVYGPVPPSNFLVLDEPSPIYTEMNWKDLNHSITCTGGSHYLQYSETHTEGYNTDTFYSHRVEFSNGDLVWFLNEAWGNGNDRYELLYDFLNAHDLFSYAEHAYTVLNWAPATSHPNLIRIGQVATGTLTLVAIDKSTQPILESATVPLAGIDLIPLEGMSKKVH